MKFKFLVSLFLLGSSLSCFAQGYKDGIEYYKVGQTENAKELLMRNLDNSSTNKAEAYYYLGCIALKENNAAQAKNYFDKGIQADAANPYNFVGQGALALTSNDPKAAADLFKDALSKVKKDPKVATAIARAYYNANAVTYAKEITKYSDQAKKWSPKDPDAYILIGDMAAAEKKWGDAAGMYEMAFTFDPENTEAYVKYANTYFFVNPKVAIEKLGTVLAKNPESALAQRELAEKYYEDDQWTKAAQQYGEYIKNPNHFKQDEVRYVALLFYGKRYEEAYSLAKELVAKLPATDKSVFYMKRMEMYSLVAMEKWNEADSAAQDFFAVPVPEGAKYEPKDYTDYGDALKKLNRPKDALAQYEKAAIAAPDKADLLKDLSSAYTEVEDYAKAAEYFQKYIDKGDYKTNDLFILSKRYSNLAATTKDSAVKADALEKALKYANEVNEKAPNDYRVIGQIARVQRISENDVKEGKAVQSYKQVLDLLAQKEGSKTENADTYIEAYQYLAKNAFENGNQAQMKEYYKLWLEVDPGNADLRKYVSTLK